jgi:1,2-diacylglycerol 3-beta-galactosyltransferase
MKIHIWTGSMGGHLRIAQALTWALTTHYPAADVQIVDIYSAAYLNQRFAGTTNAYDRVVARIPWLWGTTYHLTHQRPVMWLLRQVGSRFTRRAALHRLVEGETPDVIVNVIADLGQLHVLPRVARASGRAAPPVVTVISDLVNIHRGWLAPQAAVVVVPTDPAYDACRRYGVPADRLRRLGYPIRSHLFCRPAEAERPSREHGLRVLAMGGSSGSGRLVEDVRQLLASAGPLDLTVICGKNAGLQHKLEALAAGQNGRSRMRVLGYTDHIPELMRAADVLVTKAGPSTMFEAVASQLPSIITAHLPGQESGNAAYFARAGVAVEAPTPADTARLVRQFAADPARLQALRNPALAREACQGAQQVAAAIMETAERGGTAWRTRRWRRSG